jgi:hypothetical protein
MRLSPLKRAAQIDDSRANQRDGSAGQVLAIGLGRILPVPARSGGGRLTERIPAIQPRRGERVKVPHTCRSPYPSGFGLVGGKRSFSARRHMLQIHGLGRICRLGLQISDPSRPVLFGSILQGLRRGPVCPRLPPARPPKSSALHHGAAGSSGSSGALLGTLSAALPRRTSA